MGTWRRGKVWYAEIRVGGVRRREAVGSKEDALAVVAEWKKEIREGRHPTLRRVKPILFREHAKEVIAHHYSKKRSHKWAQQIIENRLDTFFGDHLLGSITPKTITEHMTRRREEGVSNGTINNERAVLSKIFRLAVRWGRIGANPVTQVERLEVPKGRERWLTHEEADALIAHAPKHLKPFLVTALETGGRKSEVLGLTWDHVDFDRGVLTFSQTNTKNAKARPIPMTPLLVGTLRALARSIRTDRVFVRYGKPMRDVRTAFEIARVGAGLGKDVTLHTLRHTACSWYAMRGGDGTRAMKLFGWSSEAMWRRYAHLSPGYVQSAVPLMGRHPEAPPGDASDGRAPKSSPPEALSQRSRR